MVDGSVVLEVEGAGLRNIQASLPPAAASKAATAHCMIVSFCHMMAMQITTQPARITTRPARLTTKSARLTTRPSTGPGRLT